MAKLISISDYAKLCEVSRQLIYQREKKNLLKFVEKKFRNGEIFLIDAEKFPPSTERRKRGRVAYPSPL